MSAKPTAASAKLRAAIFQSVGQPYSPTPNLWLVNSSRGGRRWILRGDLHFLYFLYLEFLPGVTRIDFAPRAAATELDGQTSDVQFHAEYDSKGARVCVALDRGDLSVLPEAAVEVQLRRHQAAGQRNAELKVVKPADLAPYAQRIQNGLRLLRCINAANDIRLPSARNAVSRVLTSGQPTTLQRVSAALPEISAPIVDAAVFQLFQRGRVKLDIENEAVHLNSRVEWRE